MRQNDVRHQSLQAATIDVVRGSGRIDVVIAIIIIIIIALHRLYKMGVHINECW